MTCEFPKERLIGFHYGEVDADEREAVRAHVAGCEACRQELEALERTGRTLRAWHDESPDFDLVFVRERAPFWRALAPSWLGSGGWRRFAAGMAVGVAAAVLILAFVNIEAGFQDGAFSLNIALRTTSPSEATRETVDPLARPVTLGEFAAYQEQSLGLIKQLLDDSEQRQRQDLGLALTQFAEDLDRQRQRDLQLVGLGLRGVEQSTNQRFNQIGRLIALTAQEGYPVRSVGQE
jgi:hypothetical protein